MADIDEIKSGIMDPRVKSSANTSMAKTMAAIGALNSEDIAPTAAQPINSVLVLRSSLKYCDMAEEAEAVETTVGPSSPADPPNPTVKGTVINEIIGCLDSLKIPLLLMAKSVADIP